MQTVSPDGFRAIVVVSEQGLIILFMTRCAWRVDLRLKLAQKLIARLVGNPAN